MPWPITERVKSRCRHALGGGVAEHLRRLSQTFRRTGQYEGADLPDLLARVNPHMAWFPSQVPETHSFTLSSALHAGLPVVVPDLAAMPERVSGLNWAWIVPPGWEAKRSIAFFEGLREANFLPHLAPLPPRGPSSVPHGFYETEYLHPAKFIARVNRPRASSVSYTVNIST